ncbi:MAG: BlaI/MecI/CopY family transcriptional regulator [Terriglobia bacterium]|jgi:predicted transcriptional regulator
MTKSSVAKPTAGELEILRILWEQGPSTVRAVHDALLREKDVGYTTVLKLMQIMTAKGTVRRNQEQRAHVYEACQPAEKTKRALAGDVLQRVFQGSASQLMMHALEGRRTSREELEKLRHLLDNYEKGLR